MTRDELIKYFSHPRYDDVRHYIYRVMEAHPDITDTYWLGAAAEMLLECADDGVELSTENAVRLTRNDKEVPIEEIVRELEEAGVTEDKFLDTIINASQKLPDYTGCESNADATRRVHEMTMLAFQLTKNSKDIVLIGRPQISRDDNSSRLALAVLCDSLTEDEQKTLQRLSAVCDDKRMFQEQSFIKLVFYVRNIWQKP